MSKQIQTAFSDGTAGGGGAILPSPSKLGKRRIDKEEIAGTLLASIPLIGFFIFGLIPLVLAMGMAFMQLPGFGLQGGEFVGMLNFKTVVEDPLFWESVVNTLILGSSTLISLVLSLLIAYLLSKPIMGKKAFRMIYFVPYVCSTVAITLMWQFMFNTNYGIINQILGNTETNPINWLGSSDYYSWAVIIMSVWSGMGYSIVLFTAALTGVNSSMVEAATIDGASVFRVFWNIILPSISPTSFYLLVTGVIGALQAFATTNVLSPDGGPNNDGVTIVYYLYQRVFNYVGKMGEASACAWILALMILAVTVVQFVGSKKWVNYD